MDLRRVTSKDFKGEIMDLGSLPDGSPPLVATDLPVDGERDQTADVILTGTEDGDAYVIYVQISYREDGELEGGWSREFTDLNAAIRVVGFLDSPISLADLSLLSFSRGY